MIQDPADEVVELVRRAGSAAVASAADRRAAALVRRRFGFALPVPLVDPPAEGQSVPVRVAVAHDGPAIAAMKWRSWRVAYRGVLPDAYLDDLAVKPPPGYWIGLGAVPPSPRHRLVVAGAPGTVFGAAQLRPIRDDDLDPSTVSEVVILYLEPLVLGRGLGAALLDAAVDHAHRSGTTDVRLWVAVGNDRARRFYGARGWRPDGAAQRVELGGGVAMDEVRYRHQG